MRAELMCRGPRETERHEIESMTGQQFFSCDKECLLTVFRVCSQLSRCSQSGRDVLDVLLFTLTTLCSAVRGYRQAFRSGVFRRSSRYTKSYSTEFIGCRVFA